jgi:membrane protease YdiL (CAAX protease family)
VTSLLGSAVKWRVGLRWFALAIGLALGLRLAVSLLALFLGLIPAIQIRPWTAAQMAALAVLLLVAAGLEELGWRGFALPRLMRQRSALFAALVLGVFWASVHLVLLLPGQEFAGMPVLAVMLGIIGISVLATWLFVRTGSVLITSLFHASQNLFVVVNEGIAQSDLLWLMAAVQLTAALALVVVAGPSLAEKPEVPSSAGRASLPLPD